SDSLHHFGANVAEAEVDFLARSSVLVITFVTTTTPTADHAVVVKEKTAKPSMFAVDSSSAGGVDPNAGVFSDLNGSDFLVSGMEHDQLFSEFNVEAARQMSLSAEVRMRAEYNIREKRRLKPASNFVTVEKSLRDEVNALTGRNIILEKERNAVDVKVADLEVSAVSKERELTDLHAHLTFVKSHNDSLADQVHELEIASF
nr:hypothetical protein [Tanacetum cinerariifolium]